MDDVRATLDRLIRENGADYAAMSRLLGRNAAYIQQFLRRGTPRKLDEDDRRTLARFFRVDETLLGGPPGLAVGDPGKRKGVDYVRIPRLPLGASAGAGALDDREGRLPDFVLDARSARALGDPAMLSMIRVDGDSMAPTLTDGDDILVDRADAADRLRDGIYVLRLDDALNVKRIAMLARGAGFSVNSDNPAFPSIADCDPARVVIVGRVVWAGRRLR
jgi:hypothetical protein